MRKSQMAAILATAYVAGGVVAPISNIYAEAVFTPDCAESVDNVIAGVVTSEDIARVLDGISNLPFYAGYKNAIDTKSKYATVREDGHTLAWTIDNAVSKAEKAATAANAAYNDAKTATNNATTTATSTSRADLVQYGKDLAPLTFAKTSSDDIVEIVDALRATVPFYTEYVSVAKAIEGRDMTTMKEATIALNAAYEAQGLTAPYDIDTIFADGKSEIVVSSDIFNASVTANANFWKYKRFAMADTTVAEIKKLEADRDEKVAAREAAVDTQNAAVEEIMQTLTDLREAGVEVAEISKPRTKAQDAIKLISETYGSKTIIPDFEVWTDFINYIEIDASATDPQFAKSVLEGYLDNDAIASDEEKEAILNPTSNHKVCSADHMVAVKGNLPIYNFGIEVIPFNNTLDDLKFAGNEQALYSIKLKYNGMDYTAFDGEGYDVVINVPSDMIGETIKVYHVANDGSIKRMASTYDEENNTITFHTPHFSVFALVGENNYGGFDPDGDSDFSYPGEVESGDADSDLTQKPGVITPKAGAASVSNATMSRTFAIVASFIAMASAAIATIARRARRKA